jgi:hypothetical protein
MISVKFDNTLVFPKIEMPIYNESSENDPEYGVGGAKMQTKLDGIIAPLVKINNIVIPFQQIVKMELTCDKIPEITLVINDTMMLIKTLDTPTNDNILQVQILPQFDNAYKKINLLFFMTHTYINGSTIQITGKYYVSKFWDTNTDVFGKISSYEFFETIAHKFGLGFCSNVSGTNDKRYIYSANKSTLDLMNSEIEYAGENEKVFDFWIDYWNNINFVDIFSEYKSIEPDENMKIWIQELDYDSSDSTDDVKPIETVAVLSNAPMYECTQLFVQDYTPISKSQLLTDEIIEIFNIDNREIENIVVIDGDIKNDIFKKYKYFGENIGDTKYLYNKATRKIFLNKLNGQNIKVNLTRPMLGLMRGGKVNFYFYDINRYLTDELTEESDIESNIILPDNIITDDSKYILNKSVSGQYYIVKSNIYYNNGKWNHTLLLGRYADKVQKYL